MADTTTTLMVRLQRRENRRKNKVRAALLLMVAANKEGTSIRRTYSFFCWAEQGNYECVCLLYYWQQHNNTLGSSGYNSSFHWCWSCLQFAVTNWEIRKRSINKYFSCFDTNNQCICYIVWAGSKDIGFEFPAYFFLCEEFVLKTIFKTRKNLQISVRWGPT